MSRKKKYDDDDGRTIVDMSDISRPPILVPRLDELTKKSKDANREEPVAKPQSDYELSNTERRAAVGGALSATLLIGGAFAAGIGILIFILSRLWT